MQNVYVNKRGFFTISDEYIIYNLCLGIFASVEGADTDIIISSRLSDT